MFQITVLVITVLIFFGFLYYFGFFNPVKVAVDDPNNSNNSFNVTVEGPEEVTEKDINRYLADNLAWQTLKNTVVFCSHEILGEKESDIYIYAMCEEFIAGDESLVSQSGFAGPVLLVVENGSIVSHKQPRDGSLYKQDVASIFPQDIQVSIFEHSNNLLENANKLKAMDFFGYEDKYEIVEQIEKTCSQHMDCETPAEYLIRSNCPYESRCINDICTVVCPIYSEGMIDGSTSSNEQLLGGDKDEHGCIGSAGYSWCDSKQKCLRIWEEECETNNKITTFDECVEAGYPVMESYPRQCRVPDGESFTEVLENSF